LRPPLNFNKKRDIVPPVGHRALNLPIIIWTEVEIAAPNTQALAG